MTTQWPIDKTVSVKISLLQALHEELLRSLDESDADKKSDRETARARLADILVKIATDSRYLSDLRMAEYKSIEAQVRSLVGWIGLVPRSTWLQYFSAAPYDAQTKAVVFGLMQWPPDGAAEAAEA